MTEAQHGCTAPAPSSFQQTSWNSWSWPLEWKVILGGFCLGVIRQRHHQSWAGELQWVTIGDKIMTGATATWWETARVPVLITWQQLDFVVNGWGHWLCNSKMKKGVFFSNCVRPMKLKLKYLFIFLFSDRNVIYTYNAWNGNNAISKGFQQIMRSFCSR